MRRRRVYYFAGRRTDKSFAEGEQTLAAALAPALARYINRRRRSE